MNGRAVVPTPPLRASARPQLRQPGGAGRNREDRGFWMELGVDGFRIDAVPFLLEDGGQDVGLDTSSSGASGLSSRGATAGPCCSARSTCRRDR